MSDIEILTAETGTVALLNKSEIDQQISTAHRYPRSVKRFRDEALAMVTLNEHIAQECIYALPRDGKTIEGPSARFAEVVASAWGNSRAGARVVAENGEFVTAQGIFHDLERNVAITYEVQRRITTSKGKRYSADMIGVTANAACSIALRNAVLKGVPKAFWADLYEAARTTAIGDTQTLANRRARALAVLQKYGVTSAKVFACLGIAGEEDITVEHLTTLFGVMTALKEGETTPEQAFAEPVSTPAVPPPQSRSGKTTAAARADAQGQGNAEPAPPAAQEAQQPPPVAQPEQPAALKRSPGDDGAPVSESVMRVFQTKMQIASLSEADLRQHFGHGYEGVTNGNYHALVAWIANPTGA